MCVYRASCSKQNSSRTCWEAKTVGSRSADTKNALGACLLLCALVCVCKRSARATLAYCILSAWRNVEAEGVPFPLASSAAPSCLRALSPWLCLHQYSLASQQQAKRWKVKAPVKRPEGSRSSPVGTNVLFKKLLCRIEPPVLSIW